MGWKALVMGGGGVRGEFEVGVLQYLAEKKIEFDFFSGVSVGALNASILAQYRTLPEAVGALVQLWDEIGDNSRVYRGCFFLNLLRALIPWRPFSRDSLHDSRPLRSLIARHVSWDRLKSSRKGWAVGVTSLTDSNYYLVSNLQALLDKDHRRRSSQKLALSLAPPSRAGYVPEKVKEFILASASMPFLFPPVDIDGHRFVDGGLRDITPLSSAFDAARDAKATDPLILAVSTDPEHLPSHDDHLPKGGLGILGRTLEILCHEIVGNDLEEAEACNRLSGPNLIQAKVLSLRPGPKPRIDVLDFNARDARKALRAHGYEIAQQVLTPLLSQLSA